MQWRAQGVGIGGKRNAEDAPFWSIIVVDIWVRGRECVLLMRSTEAMRVAYL